MGADETLSIGISSVTSGLPQLVSKGELVTYSVASNVLTATAGSRVVFTLTVNADGSWSFDLEDQLDHVDDNSNTENVALKLFGGGSVNFIDFSSIIVGIDADGDEISGAASGSFKITVEDDIPVPAASATPVSATVEEDGLSTASGDVGDLSEGNKQVGDTNADDQTSGAPGSLSSLFTVGADETLSIGISSVTSGLPQLVSKGELVTYSVASNVLTATAGSRVVFTLTVNADGSWSFDLEDQLDHVDDNSNTENVALKLFGGGSVNFIDFSSIIVGIDADGDEISGAASGSFKITVEDDIPVPTASATPVSATVEEDGLSTASGDVGDLSEGNKQVGDTNADDQTSGAPGSLSSLFTVGADETLSIGISSVTSGLPQLVSKGELVTYSVASNVLTATAGSRVVFTLTVNADGSWSFDLEDQLDHVDDNSNTENVALKLFGGGSVNFIDFSSIIVGIDADGDEISGAASGSFKITVEDDIPVPAASATPVSATVEEDGLSTASGDVGDLSEGNKQVGDTNADDQTSGAPGSLSSLFTVGADETLSIGISSVTSGLPQLVSKGELVTYSVASNVLTATAGSRVVFTLTVNADGSWSFDLEDQLDHVDDNSNTENVALKLFGGGSVNFIDFSSIIVGIDADGDEISGAASGSFKITVEDDIPVPAASATPVSATVEEDGLSTASGDVGDLSEGNKQVGDTNADDQTSGAPGSLSSLFTVGADETLSIGISSVTSGLPQLVSKGELVTYSVASNVLTATAGSRVVFTLTVNADGSWSFDLEDQLDHVDDNSNTENVALKLFGGGSVNFIDFSSIIVGIDADGDEISGAASGSFKITVEDDIPVPAASATPVSATVEEDGLSTASGDVGDLSEGNKQVGDTNADDQTSGAPGSLSSLFTVGADETLSIGISSVTSGLPQLVSKGELVTYSVASNVLTATAGSRVVFTLTVNADGSWSFDLEDQLDHVDDNSNTENVALKLFGGGSVNFIDFSSIIVGIDADGDEISGAASGSFKITVEDDIPVPAASATPVSATVEEDGLSTASGDVGDLSEGNKQVGDTNADDQTSGPLARCLRCSRWARTRR